ncbi:TrbI/VirB10 family protein [Fangia hongkongensis]|uniref:TrbI/VirB10 family protein n=1 Tax=Fangia hongkongensis TaxID=270495 RepID=UPI0003653745|nr:TrbI/VirB10 family protein [Fangia hongkongensis]MBK2126107.1 TrbI/VirB10 family protein [Fangia hongkongensis]
MSKKERQKLSVKTPPPKSSELNKKLITVVGGAILLIVIIAFIFSINTQKRQSGNVNSSNLSANSSGSSLKINNDLSSYKDAEAIRKRLGMDQPVKVVQQQNPELQRMIDQQKNQLQQLQAQINSLKSTPRTTQPTQPSYSPMDREAMNAPIFFGGGAPRPIPQDNKKEQQKLGNQPSTGKETPEQQRAKFMQGGLTAKDITNQNTIQKPISENVIMAGNSIPAILQTKISSDLPGTIVARVAKDVYDTLTGTVLLIPRGSSLIGEYNSSVQYGDTRVQVKFIRLIRPDGTSIILPNQQGMDDEGMSGLSDEVDNHWGQLIGAAALSTVFNIPAVAAQVAQQQNTVVCDSSGNNCVPNYSGVAQSSVLQSLGQTAQQVGGKITDRAMNIKPTITINAGKEFSVLVTKDTYLPPYNG